MKKIIIVPILIIIIYIVLLFNKIWIEEILLLFLLPLIISFITIGIITLIIKIFKKCSKNKYIVSSIIAASVFQLFLLLFILWSTNSRLYTGDQVKKDIDYAKVYMEDVHPDLYAEIDEDKLDNIIDSIKKTLPQSLAEVEAYQVLSTIFSNINDAHTMLSLNNYLRRGAIFFRKVPPYRLRVINDKIFVLKNYSKRKKIPVGSQIIEINNKTASECLIELSQLVSHETKNNLQANLQLPMIWGMWNNFENFTLTYKTPEGKIETIVSSSGLFSNISFLWDFTGFFLKNYSFEILNDDVGYINIKAFNNLDKCKNFFTSTFGEIRKENINNIIIDLRGNQGGNEEVSLELMQYLSPVDFRSFDTIKVKISRERINRLSIDTTIYTPGSLVLEKNSMTPLRNNDLHYNGKCYLLTSGYTFSCALDFAAMFRCYNIGEIVGTETGGKTVSFGAPRNFILPETGLEMKVSQKRFFNVCGEESKRGLIPDHKVENSIQDDINGIDRALEFILSKIDK